MKYSKLLTYSLTLLSAGLFLLSAASCRSTQKEPDTTTANVANNTVFSAQRHFEAVQSNRSKETNLTAKVRVNLQMDDKTVSTTGTLRMRRDEVVQISLVDPIVGIAEVARLEFSRDNVLFIDRFNKQYFNVPYAQVSFLKTANVDFNTLQSLFWNEVFEPGKTETAYTSFEYKSANGGAAQPQGDVVLGCSDKILSYAFNTQQPTGHLVRTSITSPADHQSKFAFDYKDFSNYSGRAFPHEMAMSFILGNKQASLSLSLNSLKNSSDWTAHSSVPTKYKQADAERIFRSLIK